MTARQRCLSISQTAVQVNLVCSGQYLSKPATGWWAAHGLVMHLGNAWGARVVRSNRRATVAQIDEGVRKESEYRGHHSLHSRRPARVPMLNPVHHQKAPTVAYKRQNSTTDQQNNVAWYVESHYLLHLQYGRCVCVIYLVNTRQQDALCEGGGSVILWAMFWWETLGPAIHVNVTLTRTTNQVIVEDHVHPFMETI